MTYNIPKFNVKLSNIHDYLDKHEWQDIQAWGIFNESWRCCTACGLIATTHRGFSGEKARIIRPEAIMRMESMKPWGMIPSDLHENVANYLFDMGWHIVNGEVVEERVNLLRSRLTNGLCTMKITKGRDA